MYICSSVPSLFLVLTTKSIYLSPTLYPLPNVAKSPEAAVFTSPDFTKKSFGILIFTPAYDLDEELPCFITYVAA